MLGDVKYKRRNKGRMMSLRYGVLFAVTIGMIGCSKQSGPVVETVPPTCAIDGPFFTDMDDPYVIAARASNGITYNLDDKERRFLKPFPLGDSYVNHRTGLLEGETLVSTFELSQKLNVSEKATKILTSPFKRFLQGNEPDVKIFQFPVDSTMSKIWIKLDASAQTEVDITSAEGAFVESGYSDIHAVDEFRQACIVQIDHPSTGYWTIAVKSHEPVYGVIKTRSSLHFKAFDYLDERIRRHAHNFLWEGGVTDKAWMRWLGRKTKFQKEPLAAQATLFGEVNAFDPKVNFSTRTLDGTLVQYLDVSPRSEGQYLLEGLLPSFDPIFIHVEGRDPNGLDFERQFPHSIQITVPPTPSKDIPYDTPYPEDSFVR